VELPSTSSLLEISRCCSVVLPSIIVIAIIAAPHIHWSNCFVSAGLLFALSFLFKTCHLPLLPESGISAAVPSPLPSLQSKDSDAWLMLLEMHHGIKTCK